MLRWEVFSSLGMSFIHVYNYRSHKLIFAFSAFPVDDHHNPDSAPGNRAGQAADQASPPPSPPVTSPLARGPHYAGIILGTAEYRALC